MNVGISTAPKVWTKPKISDPATAPFLLQNLVSRNGELWQFLTNEERDVTQEIKSVEISGTDISRFVAYELIVPPERGVNDGGIGERHGGGGGSPPEQPLGPQRIDHVFVVDDLVVHVERGAELGSK